MANSYKDKGMRYVALDFQKHMRDASVEECEEQFNTCLVCRGKLIGGVNKPLYITLFREVVHEGLCLIKHGLENKGRAVGLDEEIEICCDRRKKGYGYSWGEKNVDMILQECMHDVLNGDFSIEEVAIDRGLTPEQTDQLSEMIAEYKKGGEKQ